MLAPNIRIVENLVDQRFNSSEKRLARAQVLPARYGMMRLGGHVATPWHSPHAPRGAGGRVRLSCLNSSRFG